MTNPEALIYGLVQGITEFLPVSSSGHLALYAALIKRSASDHVPLAFPVLMHVASLTAILFVFRREIWRLVTQDRRLGLFICIATIPAAVAGVGFHDKIEQITGDTTAVALCLFVTALALIAGELVARSRAFAERDEHRLRLWETLVVGLAQAVALLPGVSRSGMTMSSGRSLGLSRAASVRFAFLLGVPAIAGAACYEGLKLLKPGAGLALDPGPATIGFLAAFVASWLALQALLHVVRRVGLWVFSPYCFALGLAALLYFRWR